MLLPLFIFQSEHFLQVFYLKIYLLVIVLDFFWERSIKFYRTFKQRTSSFMVFIFNTFLVLISIPIWLIIYFLKIQKLPKEFVNGNKPLYNFLVNKWYFDELYECILVKSFKKLGLFFWKQM